MNLTIRHLARAIAIGSLALALGACSSASKRPALDPKVEARQFQAAGQAAARAGQHEVALAEYVKALSIEPRNAELHFLAAQSQVALSKVSTASLTFRRVLVLQPDHAGALEGLGLLMLQQSQHEAARQLLEKALVQDTKAWRSLNGLGTLADLRREHAVAQNYYARALLLNQGSPMLLSNLGYSKYLAGQTAEARSLFERAVSIDPQYNQGWSNLGLVYVRQGLPREAMNAFTRTMPEAQAAYTAGYLCMLDNRLTDAEQMFQRAIDLSPSYYAEAQEGLARVKVLRKDTVRTARR
jgi:Flp pilus assembly protein TadD